MRKADKILRLVALSIGSAFFGALLGKKLCKPKNCSGILFIIKNSQNGKKDDIYLESNCEIEELAKKRTVTYEVKIIKPQIDSQK